VTSKRSLPGFKDAAPPDRYCDLVLTGGVTSAIAYPGVVFGLAQVYRFNSIGGASSGAGTAALAAAAEYRRRHGSTEGYSLMLERTRQVADVEGGTTRLERLFQPEPGNSRLFNAFKGGVNPENFPWGLVNAVLRAYWLPLTLALVSGILVPLYLGLVIGSQDWWGWLFAGFLWFFLFSLAFTLQALVADLQRMIDADFGLCTGKGSEGICGSKLPEALTDWLHGLIQDIAGLPREQPLTFEDLERAPGGPRDTLGDSGETGAKSIDLRMYASNMTEGRPQLLPQGDDEENLYFKPAELRRLFPCSVVDFMERQSVAPLQGFWTLPRKRLPVLVAARMSVSFPVLFSAVPLWRRDSRGTMQRVLMVDGGLCSNFPIHLFDTPVPAWPTFGVALHDTPSSTEITVCVPQSPDTPAPAWRWNLPPKGTLYQLWTFVEAALGTMKDWNDRLQSELPGIRERLAHVWLPKGIGGLNIGMNSGQIEQLAEAGAEVARQLVERYAFATQGSPHGAGWREHRWQRLNVLSHCLHGFAEGLTRSMQGGRHSEPLREQIRAAARQSPLPGGVGPAPIEPAEAARLEQFLDTLTELEARLAQSPPPQDRTAPLPVLRVRSSR
jgi:predicted acylesterase/phospholipase RssA